ncbi:hypothetical protein EAS62_26885 [Bradyrhizobium zhanjiangense]|uniref:Uncharacterized protein n=1 Tax=Bradyrhizobium zhanjiangense TaxID=1325107 RepID=A0ABY0DFW9_9BRAD|nr:hypothetical protein EAS62_26885 [Bradyrhizobium zhanjiangense]
MFEAMAWPLRRRSRKPQQIGGADQTLATPSPPLTSPYLEQYVMVPLTKQRPCRIENWMFSRDFVAGCRVKLSTFV